MRLLFGKSTEEKKDTKKRRHSNSIFVREKDVRRTKKGIQARTASFGERNSQGEKKN